MSTVFKAAKNIVGTMLGGGTGGAGTFGGKEYPAQYPAPWAYPQAQSWIDEINKNYLPKMDAMRSYGTNLMGLGERAANTGREQDYLRQVQNWVNAGQGTNNALWNLTAKRYMDQLTPRYSGAGLLTSGPGLNAMSQGMEDLAIKYGDAERARQAGEFGLLGGATQQLKGAETGGVSAYSAALEGLKALEALPIEIRRKLIETLFGQKGEVPGVGPSILSQMGGGGGIGSLIGSLAAA